MALTIGGQIRKEVTNLIQANPSDIKMVEVKKIQVGKNRIRYTDAERVENYARSFKVVGAIFEPILITKEFVLVAGLHRLEACQLLKWKEIPCRIVDVNPTQARLIEIDENLIRSELNEIEKGEALLEKERILEEMHMRSKPEYEKYIKDPANFAVKFGIKKEIAKNIGLSERSVELKKQIARGLSERVKRCLIDTEVAKNQAALEQISKMSEDDQIKAAKMAVDYVEKHGTDKGVAKALKEFKMLQKQNNNDKTKKRDKEEYDNEFEFIDGKYVSLFDEPIDEPDLIEKRVIVNILESAYDRAAAFAEEEGITIEKLIERLIEEL